MKKVWILFVLLIACEANTANPPPAILIPEDTMEYILYDITLLKSITNNRFGRGTSKAVLNNQYILRKYNIEDSVLKQNQTYYAQSPKKMAAIYNRIYERLERVEDSIGLLVQKEQKELNERLQREKDSIAARKQKDSLALVKQKDSLKTLKEIDSLAILKRKDTPDLLKEDNLGELKASF